MNARYYLLCMFVFCVGAVFGSVTKRTVVKSNESLNTDTVLINHPVHDSEKKRHTKRMTLVPSSQIKYEHNQQWPDHNTWVIEVDGKKYFAREGN